jgi:signal transduction histidine kinase
MRWTLTPLQPERLEAARRGDREPADLPQVITLAVGIDITDHLELERRDAESQALAAIGTLTTSLAHEIRNPLNAAKLQLELLARRAQRAGDRLLDGQLTEPAKLVRLELERLTTLLDEFLELARPRVPVRQPYAVHQLFEAVRTLEEPLAKSVGIAIHSHVAEGLTARCDPDKLKHVLINLVRNSIDAMAGRGFGEIRLCGERRAEGGVEIEVVDDGPGLPLEMQGGAAFEPFATTKPAGTGLGLSIAQKIIAQHGGTIELSSPPEGGTLARLFLSD